MQKFLKTAALFFFTALSSCSSLPEPKMDKFDFPRDKAFVGDVKRPYDKLGPVRSKINFTTLDWVHEEDQLCKNYYNKAVQDLVKMAKDKGADAVIDVRSVVFFENGQSETYTTPECADDGEGGQILAEGIAVKWKPQKTDTSTP